MDIECCMLNENSSIYKNIMFRKYFQIIFFNENMKRIDIYTATILGAKENCSEGLKYENYNSSLNEDFKMNFNYKLSHVVGDSYEIIHEDLTNSFLSQVEKTKLIWGNQSQKVTMQKEIEVKLSKVLNTYRSFKNCKNSEKCDTCSKRDECKEKNQCLEHLDCNNCTNFCMNEINKELTTSQQYLFVGDDEDRDVSLAVKGNPDMPNERNKPYIIKGSKKLHQGVEVVNWIHTKIIFDKRQNFKTFKYIVRFPECRMWTPDFTIYIGPPEGYAVNLSSSMCKVDDNESLRDIFQEVAVYEELYYDEWKKDCNIMNKKMHRVLKGKVFRDPEREFKGNKVELLINFRDEVGKEKFQFIFGIIISAMLAFGIDYTRIGQMKACFFPKFISPDIQWVVTCLIVLSVFTTSWRRNEYMKKGGFQFIAKIISFLGTLCIGLWFIFTFVIYQGYVQEYAPWKSIVEKLLKNTNIISNFYVLLIAGWGLSVLYIVLSKTLFKKYYLSKNFIFSYHS